MTHCLYCKDAAGTLVACPGCQATYHGDCLLDELNGACATLGCGHVHALGSWFPEITPERSFALALIGFEVLGVGLLFLLKHLDAPLWILGSGACLLGGVLMLLIRRLDAGDVFPFRRKDRPELAKQPTPTSAKSPVNDEEAPPPPNVRA